jgi:hypothetical protein
MFLRAPLEHFGLFQQSYFCGQLIVENSHSLLVIARAKRVETRQKNTTFQGSLAMIDVLLSVYKTPPKKLISRQLGRSQ